MLAQTWRGVLTVTASTEAGPGEGPSSKVDRLCFLPEGPGEEPCDLCEACPLFSAGGEDDTVD
jgi:hypothetical protein